MKAEDAGLPEASRRRRRKKNRRPAINAKPTTPPITPPAIAPACELELDDLGVKVLPGPEAVRAPVVWTVDEVRPVAVVGAPVAEATPVDSGRSEA